MDIQRWFLFLVACAVLGGDAWQDYYAWQHQALTPLELFSAAVRTTLLLATLAAIVRPGRRLLLLAVVAISLALLRRALFLAPLVSVLDPAGPFLGIFHSGLDLSFRLAVMGWALHELRRSRDPE